MANQLTYEIELSIDQANKKLDSLLRNQEKNAQDAGKKSGAEFGKQFKSALQSILATVSFAAILNQGKKAFSAFSTFDDALADIQKTSGVTGDELKQLGDDLLKLGRDTRTPNEELLKIAENAGRLGIQGADAIFRFTEAVNQVSVALGDDFSGGGEQATQLLGKLNTLFIQTRDLSPEESLMRTGSVLNELSASGASSAGNIAEFVTRTGQLPEVLRPSIQDTAALASFLEEVGLSSEVASGGFANFFLRAGQDLAGLAAQIGITKTEAEQLLANDPTQFVLEFSKSLEGLNAEQLANTLKDLGIGTQETIKVLGALSTEQGRVAELQDIANRAFEEGTSLTNEYRVKNNTAAAEAEKLANKIDNLQIKVGEALAPAVLALFEELDPVLALLIDFVAQNPQIVAALFAITAGVTALAASFFFLGLPITAAIALIGLLFLAYTTNFAGMQDVVDGFVESIQESFARNAGSIELLKRVVQGLGLAFQTAFGSVIIPVLDNFFSVAGTVINGVLSLMNNLNMILSGQWKQGFVNIFKGLGSIMIAPFRTAMNGIRTALNTGIDAYNNVAGGASKLGVDLPKINRVPEFAQGGFIDRPTLGLFGEAGPEAILNQNGIDALGLTPSLVDRINAGNNTNNTTNNLDRSVQVNNYGNGLYNDFDNLSIAI